MMKITETDANNLLKNIGENPKYKLIVLLMLDAGLRVTETISLRFENIDFPGRELNVISLKKKSVKPVYRKIPMTYRLYDALSAYCSGKTIKQDLYLFPSPGSLAGHLTRKSVWKYLKKRSSQVVSPHMLRHTFASNIVNSGGDIKDAQKLLGHSSQLVTEAYLHADRDALVKAVKRTEKPSLFEKFRRKVVKQKVFHFSSSLIPDEHFIGRKDELAKISDAIERKINLYIEGEQGAGKTKILKRFDSDKILFLDDFRSVKKTLGALLLHLHTGEKRDILEALSSSHSSLKTYITKESTSRLVELLTNCCERNEYTIMIDDLTNVTTAGVTALEKLKDHFHMIVAARKIKIANSSFLVNFEKLTVSNFSRELSTKLVYKLSYSFKDRVEDFEAYKNHVINVSAGNPGKIFSLVERFSKEYSITHAELKSIDMTYSRNTIDFSFPILLFLSSLMILRYVGTEIGDDSGAFRLFGGFFLVLALFSRSIFQLAKRKYI